MLKIINNITEKLAMGLDNTTAKTIRTGAVIINHQFTNLLNQFIHSNTLIMFLTGFVQTFIVIY